jgi:hypothetical protein
LIHWLPFKYLACAGRGARPLAMIAMPDSFDEASSCTTSTLAVSVSKRPVRVIGVMCVLVMPSI